MKTITELNVKKGQKDKISLYLDNGYYCDLNLETVVKYGLKVGMIIAESKIEEFQMESEKSFAFNKALKLLNTRYKTKKEIYNYLVEKGYLPAVINYCVNKLEEYKYIDDERYAESYVSHKVHKDGKNKIKQELLAKGVKETIINQALSKYDEQNDVIQTLAEKYMKNKQANKENYAKLFRYLVGKGFDYSDIKSVLKGLED